MIRQMIKIDAEKCDGCGLCIIACEEGALQIVDGKATLIKDDYCDGLGNCLPACPQDAIQFEQREAVPFNEEAVAEHLKNYQQDNAPKNTHTSHIDNPLSNIHANSSANTFDNATVDILANELLNTHPMGDSDILTEILTETLTDFVSNTADTNIPKTEVITQTHHHTTDTAQENEPTKLFEPMPEKSVHETPDSIASSKLSELTEYNQENATSVASDSSHTSTSNSYDIYEQFTTAESTTPLSEELLFNLNDATPNITHTTQEETAIPSLSQFLTEEPRVIIQKNTAENTSKPIIETIKTDTTPFATSQASNKTESNQQHTNTPKVSLEKTTTILLNTRKTHSQNLENNQVLDTNRAGISLQALDSELAQLDEELEQLNAELKSIDEELTVIDSHIDEEIAHIEQEIIEQINTTIINTNQVLSDKITAPNLEDIKTQNNQQGVSTRDLENKEIPLQTISPKIPPLQATCKGMQSSNSIITQTPSKTTSISHDHQNTTKQSNTPITQLRQWPVQLKLVPVNADYFSNAHLLIAADCCAYSYAHFHNDFMHNKITLIGCPKLDNCDYTEKLTEILCSNTIKSVTVVRMEVPCCSKMEKTIIAALKQTIEKTGKFLPWQSITIGTKGNILE